MKNIISALIYFLGATSIAAAKAPATYKKSNVVGYYAADNETCLDGESTKFIYGNRFCSYSVTDTISILKLNSQQLQVTINTNGAEGNECFIHGIATRSSKSNFKLKGNSEEPADTCEVEVSFKPFGKVSVTSDGDCTDYCGQGVDLSIKNANKQ
jgi:hypothetical protein